MKETMFVKLRRILYRNPLKAGFVYVQVPNVDSTVPADGLAPKGARPSAGTVLTTS